MAYIVGLLTKEEQEELERRGWEVEDAPKELIDDDAPYDKERMKMVWVDTSMFDVMDGPDWDKGKAPEHTDDWHCRKCNEGPYGDETNYCSNCGEKHNQDDVIDSDLGEDWRNNLQPGDEVTWNDPDEGKCSGVYKIVKINAEEGQDRWDVVFSLKNDSGSEVEAYGHELS